MKKKKSIEISLVNAGDTEMAKLKALKKQSSGRRSALTRFFLKALRHAHVIDAIPERPATTREWLLADDAEVRGSNTFCRNPLCENRAKGARGLCNTCYVQAMRMVNAGETTWEKLSLTGKTVAKWKKLRKTKP